MSPHRRLLATVATVLALLAASASPASAEDTIWARWLSAIPRYEPKVLLPLAVFGTLPPLMVTTPIELGAMAIRAVAREAVFVFGGGEDEDEE